MQPKQSINISRSCDDEQTVDRKYDEGIINMHTYIRETLSENAKLGIIIIEQQNRLHELSLRASALMQELHESHSQLRDNNAAHPKNVPEQLTSRRSRRINSLYSGSGEGKVLRGVLSLE